MTALPSVQAATRREVLDLAERGTALIRDAADLAEASLLRAQAVAIEDLTRTMSLGDEAKRAAKTLRLRCERRLGELLREGKANGTVRSAGRVDQSSTSSRIADLGLTANESSTFQKLADVDDDKFEDALTQAAALPSRSSILSLDETRRAPRHPARYSDDLLPIFAAALAGYVRVLDPFAGTGRIHELAGHDTVGVELEPEWAAMHPGTVVGNALDLSFDNDSFDAICTSPTYGNRFADHHIARDGSTRRSYTHDLGRQLHDDNSGILQWGDQYRDFHHDAWTEAERVLRPGGRFVLNISDHVRDGDRMPVSAWHLDHLIRTQLLTLYDIVPVPTSRMRFGDNAERPLVEFVFILDKEGP